MTANGFLQIGLYFLILLAVTKPLGWYMARVYEGQPIGLDRVLGPVERFLYRLAGVRPEQEMDWKRYAMSMLLFSGGGMLLLYALQRLQGWLPLNPAGAGRRVHQARPAAHGAQPGHVRGRGRQRADHMLLVTLGLV
jgi:K+-transporting ATPase ATPase A chain